MLVVQRGVLAALLLVAVAVHRSSATPTRHKDNGEKNGTGIVESFWRSLTDWSSNVNRLNEENKNNNGSSKWQTVVHYTMGLRTNVDVYLRNLFGGGGGTTKALEDGEEEDREPYVVVTPPWGHIVGSGDFAWSGSGSGGDGSGSGDDDDDEDKFWKDFYNKLKDQLNNIKSGSGSGSGSGDDDDDETRASGSGSGDGDDEEWSPPSTVDNDDVSDTTTESDMIIDIDEPEATTRRPTFVTLNWKEPEVDEFSGSGSGSGSDDDDDYYDGTDDEMEIGDRFGSGDIATTSRVHIFRHHHPHRTATTARDVDSWTTENPGHDHHHRGHHAHATTEVPEHHHHHHGHHEPSDAENEVDGELSPESEDNSTIVTTEESNPNRYLTPTPSDAENELDGEPSPESDALSAIVTTEESNPDRHLTDMPSDAENELDGELAPESDSISVIVTTEEPKFHHHHHHHHHNTSEPLSEPKSILELVEAE